MTDNVLGVALTVKAVTNPSRTRAKAVFCSRVRTVYALSALLRLSETALWLDSRSRARDVTSVIKSQYLTPQVLASIGFR